MRNRTDAGKLRYCLLLLRRNSIEQELVLTAILDKVHTVQCSHLVCRNRRLGSSS